MKEANTRLPLNFNNSREKGAFCQENNKITKYRIKIIKWQQNEKGY